MKFERVKQVISSRTFKIASLSFLAGIAWFVAVRVIAYSDDHDHYHANFALYIHDEQETFSEPIFYEEISACGVDSNDPGARVHMHDNVGSVIHVHDASSTWGNFFENIGFVLGDNLIYARSDTFVDGRDGDLTFILNGQEVRSLANKTIQSEDVLLINFGDVADDVLMERFYAIERTAGEYNVVADPAACSGAHETSLLDRFKIVLGL